MNAPRVLHDALVRYPLAPRPHRELSMKKDLTAANRRSSLATP